MELDRREKQEQQRDQSEGKSEQIVSVSIITRASANDDYQFGVCRLLDFFNALGEIAAGGVIETRSGHWRASVNRFMIQRKLSWHEDLASARQGKLNRR